MSSRKLIALAVMLIWSVGLCLAASQNATVTGGVYDPTGKPLPAIRVVLENPALGFERESATAEDGSYTFTEVPPQDGYRLTAYRGAAKIAAATALTIAVGEDKSILPPLREQAAATAVAGGEVKEQHAAAVTNETITTSLSGVISGDQLRSLPLFNRNFLVLGLLTPNTHDVEGGSGLAGATFSIAGSRPNTNMFLLDGSDNVARSSNQAIPFQVNDSVQEFRVISSTANAEYGGASGGVINVVTRRASNTFHGSGFGYFNNDALNASNPLSVYNGSGFDKSAANAGANVSAGQSPLTYNSYVRTAALRGFCTDSIGPVAAAGTHPCLTGGFGKNTLFDPAAVLAANDSHTQPFDSRQFGGNAGGALIKDKLFLFGSYEGTLINNPNQIFERVPSTFDRTYNPLRAAGVPNSAAYGFSPKNVDYQVAAKTMALFPLPNVVAVPNALEFFKGEAPNYTDVHNGLLKADFAQSKATNWSFRYSLQNLDQLHDDTLPRGLSSYPGNGAYRGAFNQNITLSNTHTVNSRIVMDSRVGFTRFRINETAQDAGFDATSLGFPGKQMMTVNLAGLDPQYSGASANQRGAFASWLDAYWIPNSFSTIKATSQYPTLGGNFPMARLGAPLSAPGQRRDSTWLLDESLSWTAGRHILKFGGGYNTYQNRVFNGGFSRGLLTASNIGEFTSDSLSGILTGEAFFAPTFDFVARQPNSYKGRFNSFAVSGFFQDSFKVHPRVLLNLGLRYDYFSTPREAADSTWNFDPLANGLVQQGTNSVVDPFGHPCVKSGNTVLLDSIYGDAAEGLGWACNPTGHGGLPGAGPYNYAPRMGVAWDLFGNGGTVLRAGVGWFYDHTPVNYNEQLLYNRPTELDTKNPQALYGNNFLTDLCFQCALGNSTVDQSTIPANIRSLFAFFQAAASPFAVYGRDTTHFGTPNTMQFNTSVQQRITDKLALEVGYVQTTGGRLPVINESGFNNEWFCNISKPNAAANNPGCDAVNPVFTMANQALSNYNSLMARVRGAQFHGLSVNATYVFSRSFDNASNAVFPVLPITLQNQLFGFGFNGLGVPLPGTSATISSGGATQGHGHDPNAQGVPLNLASDTFTGGLVTTGAGQVLVSRYTIPQDPNNYLRDDYGRSDFDTTHRLVVDYAWDVPFMNHASARAANLLGHWKLSGVFTAQTGQPFTVFAGPIGGEATQRANQLTPLVKGGDPNHYLDPVSFSLPGTVATPGADCASHLGITKGAALFSGNLGLPCTGTSKRNQFTGPGLAQMNLALQKGIQMGESRMLTFRAEFYNLFNRENFYNHISAISLDGLTINPDFGRIKSAHEPFQVQLAARFSW